MCGFLGGVFNDTVTDQDVAAVRAAVATLDHRGPDSDGLTVVPEANAVLAFRRLSIIDLSGGDQPVVRENRHHLIFNGEIYNYKELRPRVEKLGAKLSTASDTEVLLQTMALKGVAGLDDLRGMFAFAYLDSSTGELLLVRDRLGVKQLYHVSNEKGFFFSSEPKALVALPWVSAEMDPGQLLEYFAFRCVPAPRTLFKGIRKLRAGTFLKYRSGVGISEERSYWEFPDSSIDPEPTGPGSALERFEGAFLTSLERRLVSDVPVGAFLSGGLDSSLVVAGIHRLGRSDLATFSATFPGSKDDEASFAELVSNRFGFENHQFPMGSDDFLGTLPRWVNLNDDLVADASSLPLLHVSDMARREGRKVVLSGEGADELFGGYGSYHKFRILNLLARLIPGSGIRGSLARGMNTMGVFGAQDVPRVDEYFVRRSGYMGTAAILGDSGLQQLLPSTGTEELRALPRSGGNNLAALGAFDFQRRIPDDLLVRTDRATMGASVEARVPFLDHDLVELTAGLPGYQKSLPGFSKVLLRRLALRWDIPRKTITHRKIGFQIPVGQWFRGPLRSVWTEILERRAIASLDYELVQDWFASHSAGRVDLDELLWRLMALEAWHARWIDDDPLPFSA